MFRNVTVERMDRSAAVTASFELDGPQFREQRHLMLELRASSRLEPSERKLLDGLIELTDHIADVAHDKYNLDCLLSVDRMHDIRLTREQVTRLHRALWALKFRRHLQEIHMEGELHTVLEQVTQTYVKIQVAAGITEDSPPSKRERGRHEEVIPAIRIVAPEWFKRADFMEFVRSSPSVATWHRGSEGPNEWSDVFIAREWTLPRSRRGGVYESSDFDPTMPKDICEKVCAIATDYGYTACLIWIMPAERRVDWRGEESTELTGVGPHRPPSGTISVAR